MARLPAKIASGIHNTERGGHGRPAQCGGCGRPAQWTKTPPFRMVNEYGEPHQCATSNGDHDEHETTTDAATALASLKRAEVRSLYVATFPTDRTRSQYLKTDAMRDALTSGEAVAADAITTAPVGTGGDAIVEALAAALAGRVGGSMDEDRVREIAADEASKATAGIKPREVIVTTPSGARVHLDGTHKAFDAALIVAQTRTPLMLVGPAGCGKTTLAEQLAMAIFGDVARFYPLSVGPDTREPRIMGYMGATGQYVEGALYRPYRDGGVILFDEMDTANAAVLTCLNSALANGYAMFPNGELVRRHADCIIIAGANTYGRGADAEYVGRQQMDAATRNRFAFLTVDIDEDVETAAALGENPNAAPWIAYVREVRAAVKNANVRHIVSPRASIYGARLLAAGIVREQVAEMTIWQGLGANDRAKIEGAMRNGGRA